MKSAKMDWPRLEDRIRQALKDYQSKPLDEYGNSAYDTLKQISDILGEETGRGFVLPD